MIDTIMLVLATVNLCLIAVAVTNLDKPWAGKLRDYITYFGVILLGVAVTRFIVIN